ncbi:hypothetical protein RRG08_033367 [Elysia crispata]|uniref:Uncharacterized protein n=1 Tax=Elysia crispata TaxID=231223 RepID=A0AAE0Z7S2_9GAST|nr:hypothetical protein RRG08_033367 [Elysia crispata]
MQVGWGAVIEGGEATHSSHRTGKASGHHERLEKLQADDVKGRGRIPSGNKSRHGIATSEMSAVWLFRSMYEAAIVCLSIIISLQGCEEKTLDNTSVVPDLAGALFQQLHSVLIQKA